jgi:hypothetical protein
MDAGIDRARTMLQSAVTLEIVSAGIVNNNLEVNVRLTNNSGHKTPTSYPSRRMWLNLKVTDSNGQIMFESGKINSNGSIVGANNDTNQTSIEPHYDLITNADQVQIYEAMMGNSDGQTTYTLLRAAQYLKDNRLTPQGFDKAQVETKVAVWGEARNDANFNNGSDTITYRIPVTASGNLNVSVDLNYQSIMHGFIADLYRDSDLPEVQTFKNMYDPQSLKHETITSAQTLVENSGGTTPAPTPSVNLLANPTTPIAPGESVNLQWNASDANSCASNWAGNVATSGSQTVSPSTTTTYLINCSGDGGNASDSVLVEVTQPPVANEPTVSLYATPSSLRRGQWITLSWQSTDATSCAASGHASWSGSKPTSGSQTFSLDAPATFALTCSGEGGEASNTVTYRSRGRRWLYLR